jgi:uncharacterized repeat protein (TIGR03803 family)
MASLPAAAAPTFTVLHPFSGTDGDQPQGGLLQDLRGNIYGETQLGGTAGLGNIYAVSRTGAAFASLYSFGVSATDGQVPTGGLRNIIGDAQIVGADYGVAQTGGTSGFAGTVFASDLVGHEFTIHNFSGPDGQTPTGRLLPWINGFYYGTTSSGGGIATGENGVIFAVSPLGAFKVLHKFSGPDGAGPFGGLEYGNDGNFYGATTGGGAFGNGVIFRISPSGAYKVIYNFTGGNDGASPEGSLVTDFHGNLYGVANTGGAGGAGTIFKVTQWGTLTTLYAFTGANDGGFPQAGLALGLTDDEQGLFTSSQARNQYFERAMGHLNGYSAPIVLYGTATAGGADSSGVVFSLNVATKAYNVIWTFTGGTDGSTPLGKLLVSFDGNIYGTASSGGAGSDGVVFKIGGVLSGMSTTRPSFHAPTHY